MQFITFMTVWPRSGGGEDVLVLCCSGLILKQLLQQHPLTSSLQTAERTPPADMTRSSLSCFLLVVHMYTHQHMHVVSQRFMLSKSTCSHKTHEHTAAQTAVHKYEWMGRNSLINITVILSWTPNTCKTNVLSKFMGNNNPRTVRMDLQTCPGSPGHIKTVTSSQACVETTHSFCVTLALCFSESAPARQGPATRTLPG